MLGVTIESIRLSVIMLSVVVRLNVVEPYLPRCVQKQDKSRKSTIDIESPK
jgi:hypothetical protein